MRNNKIDIIKKYLFAKINVQYDYTEFSHTFSLYEAGLYFYRFEIKKKDDIYFCGKDQNEDSALIGDWLPEWQLTVYDSKFSTPDWFGHGITYQIFVDRFCRGEAQDLTGICKEYVLRDDWGGTPFYKRDPDGNMINNDFFGGNLDGIIMKLDYLADLGVSCLYLNPIFEAFSNHKYDIADYMHIDPMFGDTEKFTELCRTARKKGIRIILDGVFSHTGSDSIYFNKDGHYGDGGAYNSQGSPYYGWYSFKKWPSDYNSWWGIKILPCVKEEEPSFLDFITGDNGVLRYWLRNGASGWRLDVADELPDLFLEKLRNTVKSEKSDSVIIGEVWEDASNKESYRESRRYLQGSQLDSAMNYPFQNAIIDFVKGGKAENFKKQILSILQNYPEPSINCLMNIIGTHDTLRIITRLSSTNIQNLSIKEKADYKMSEADYLKARDLLFLATAIQYTLPGAPCIYYGDETGLQGYEDPFNRYCFPWGHEDLTLLDWYKKLGKIRNDNITALNGKMRIVNAQDNLVIYSRGEIFFTAVNTGEYPVKVDLPAGNYINLITNEDIGNIFTLNNKNCMLLLLK